MVGRWSLFEVPTHVEGGEVTVVKIGLQLAPPICSLGVGIPVDEYCLADYTTHYYTLHLKNSPSLHRVYTYTSHFEASSNAINAINQRLFATVRR